MSKETKERKSYESPVVMALGELARGMGADCTRGNSAHDRCSVGNGAESFACSIGDNYTTPSGCYHGESGGSGYCQAGPNVSY